MMSFTSETQELLFGMKFFGSTQVAEPPVTGSVEPIACCVTPFRFGAHGSSAPVAALTAPALVRGWPSSLVKSPPTQTDCPPGPGAIACTGPVAAGFQVLSS